MNANSIIIQLIPATVYALILLITYLYHKKKSIENEATTYLLDKVAKNLSQQALDNQKTLSEALHKERQVESILLNNRDVVNKNVAILNKNTTELFHVKECSVWLYDHYSSIIKLIESIDTENRDNESNDFLRIEMVRIDAIQGMELVENYFKNTFGLSPKDYKKSKQNILGTRPNGGNSFLSESSIN